MLFPILNFLCFYISTFRSTCAVPNMDFFLYFLDVVLSRCIIIIIIIIIIICF
jgi:hypothetical protein